MLGPIFVFGLLAYICYKALQDPAHGVIGFYLFVTLDPVWNWRWSLPAGFEYQNYIVLAIFAGWMFSGFRTRSLSKHTKFGLASLTAFYLWAWICTLQSIDQLRSYHFMEYFGKTVLIFVIGILTIRTRRQVFLLILLSFLGLAYNSYQINLNYFQTGFAKFAYSDWGSKGVDNNGYQLITLPIIGLGVSLFLHESRIKIKAAYAGLTLLMIHQIMLSFSRGAMVGGLAMIPVIAIRIPKGKHNLAFLLALAISAGLLAGPSVIKEFNTIFAEEENRDSSAESRVYLWKAGWRITMDHPIFGVGPDAARRLVATDRYYDGKERSRNKALHNLFFDISTGMGIPGFFLAMPFFFIPCIQSLKKRAPSGSDLTARIVANGVLFGTTGYMVGSMFSSGLLFETSYILLLAGYCNLNLTTENPGIRVQPSFREMEQAITT